jgi:hypothetical protein
VGSGVEREEEQGKRLAQLARDYFACSFFVAVPDMT